jgi:hypothetical protein
MPSIGAAVSNLVARVSAKISATHPNVVRQSMIGVAWSVAIAAVVSAWILGVPRLQAFASHARFADRVEVHFVSIPAWVTPEIHERLIRSASSCITGDPLNNADLIECRNALLASGWFEDVSQVRRVRPDLVEIDAQFAHPYAVIRDDEGDHLVDVIGRLLPWAWPRGEASRRTKLTAITGAHFARPHMPGTQWEGTDVIAGIRLLNMVERQVWKDQVMEIDVTGYVRGEPMKLRTTNGTTIVWGSSPGEEQALEVLAAGKLKRLEYLFVTYGRIDAGESGGELDITSEKAVVTRSEQ